MITRILPEGETRRLHTFVDDERERTSAFRLESLVDVGRDAGPPSPSARPSRDALQLVAQLAARKATTLQGISNLNRDPLGSQFPAQA